MAYTEDEYREMLQARFPDRDSAVINFMTNLLLVLDETDAERARVRRAAGRDDGVSDVATE